MGFMHTLTKGVFGCILIFSNVHKLHKSLRERRHHINHVRSFDMMTADKLGWRSESRPDIAREYARIASRQRNQALDKFVAANEELFAANARKQRRIGLILGAVVSLIFVGLLMYTHYE